MISGQNNGKTHTKQMEKRLGMGFLSSTQQHSAALSSTQQCSICNQFQGFLTFCRVRVEKVRTKPKNNAKSTKKFGKTMRKDTHKTNGKRHGIVFLTIFKVFSLFAGSGVKKVRTKPKKSTKSIKTMGKHTQNKWKKAWNWISQQHTPQHSAVLNLQPKSRFPDFLQGQRKKGENEAKK